MIFQAMGARYTFRLAVKHLFTHGTSKDAMQLEQELSTRYGGSVMLRQKGRSALAQAVLTATGGKSAKVAVSGLTCYSVVQAVEAVGCTPVYVDIREEDLHFGGEELAAAVNAHSDIKAVIVQNMLGIPADIAGIHEVAQKSGMRLIEDLAHSAGAQYTDGREVGTVGDSTMLSFGRDKAIDTVNGGAYIERTGSRNNDTVPTQPTTCEQLRDRLYPLIAWLSRGVYTLTGKPYVMAGAIKCGIVRRSADGDVDFIQGARKTLAAWQAKLAVDQIKTLPVVTEARRTKAHRYASLLQEFIPKGTLQAGAVPIRVPLLVSNRDEVVAHLKAHGIQVNDIWYDVPVSPPRFYDKVDYPESECPVSVRTATRLLNLPTHERISSNDIERIAKLVREVAQV